MAQKSSFFNAVINNGVPDRVYKAEEFADYFSSFISNGVFPNPGTNLQVKSNSDMTVVVNPGKAWINGYYYINTDNLILSIDNADGVLKRIDRVVVRLDYIERNITCNIKKGSFASDANAPILQRDVDAYELCIAEIQIDNGVIDIQQSKITDTRLNSDLCGIVTQTINEIDTTTLYNQLQAHIEEKSIDMKTWIEEAKEYFSNWLSTTQTEYNDNFNSWFDEVKGTLEGDVAGNLLVKINELEEVVNNLDLVASKVTMSDGNTVEDAITANKTSILNNTNLANQALDRANEAFQRGDNVKTQLVDKLISEGLDVSTDNTFEELIGNISLGKKWASGVSPVSTSTRLFYTMGGESSYYRYYFEIPLLGFNPNHVIFIGKTSTEISGYVSNLIQKYVTNGDIYINTYSKYSKDASVTANTFCYEVAGEVLQTGIAMRIPCTSASSLQNTEVSWIAFE